MTRVKIIAAALISVVLTSSIAIAKVESAQKIDYLNDEFSVRRVLDWGTRPIWSPDGAKLVFTRSHTEASPAYELDLGTGAVRCITCRWGPNGLVSRIFYLPDGSYLMTAASGLEAISAERSSPSGRRVSGTELYWMPASLSMPPQALQAKAFGDIAILHPTLQDGGFRIAWGVTGEPSQLVVADLVHERYRAALTNRRVVYSYPPSTRGSLATFAEAYDFADDGAAVVFWTLEGSLPRSAMYKVRIDTGVVTRLPGDGSHSETHLFPDERHGLEESNRVSDPDGPLRGISGLSAGNVANLLKRIGTPNAEELASRNSGRGFDLFVRSYDASNRIRRLTNVSHLGGEVHQSIPARDGRRIAFALRAPKSGPYAGKSGLYVGEFVPKDSGSNSRREK